MHQYIYICVCVCVCVCVCIILTPFIPTLCVEKPSPPLYLLHIHPSLIPLSTHCTLKSLTLVKVVQSVMTALSPGKCGGGRGYFVVC